MRDRPLCVGCGVFTIVLFLLLTIFPVRTYNVDTLLGETITVSGKVSLIRFRNDSYQIYIKSQAGSGYKCKGVIAYLKDESALPHIGAKVCVQGKVSDFTDATNEGQFSMKRYYQIRGMDFALKNASVISESNSYNYLKHVCFKINSRLCKNLNLILPSEYASIMGAILLGNKDELNDETKSLYQRAGISHALCISGLHISLIGMAVYELLKRLAGLSVKTALISAAILLIYGIICGNAPATNRAIVMFVIMIFGDITGRSYDLCTALCISGVLSLIKNPLIIYDSGFLLSYSAVLSVGIVLPFLRKIYRPFLKYKVFNSCFMSLSVTVLTLPFSLYFFYQYPVYSLLLNIFVIPLLSILLFTGIIALVLATFHQKLGIYIALICKAILFLYEKSCEVFTNLPGASFITGRPLVISILIYYLVIFLFIKFCKRNEKFYFPVCFASAVFLLIFKPATGMELNVIDVGQGNSVFVQSFEGKFLFDGGSSDVKEVGKYRIIPFLKSKGVRKLDAIFVSHADDDHVNAIIEMLKDKESEIKISRVFLTNNTLESEKGKYIERACHERGIKVATINKGDCFEKGKLRINCIYPDGKSKGEANELSMVIKLSYKKVNVIIPGDMEGDMAQREAMKEIKEPVFCYIVAHHGSSGSSNEDFLNCINPRVSLISCGINNSYGHPHKELLERLEKIESMVYITNKNGEITLKTDGRKCVIKPFKGGKNEG